MVSGKKEPPSVSDALKQKIAAFPRTPGVYLMKNARGVVIYVGKAKSLHSRVASYFRKSPGDTRAKVPGMVAQVADIEYIEAPSEVDALLMESRLVKDIQPRYNADLRDSKLFPYFEIRRGEDFPRVCITRQRDNRRSKYYGPFTDTRGLRHALQMLQRVFLFRTCTLEISADDTKRRFQRPCLLHYIKQCIAPCADLVSCEDYRKQLRLLDRLLEGKRSRVMVSLKREMKKRSEALNFEEAARLRDQIRAMEALGKRGEKDYFPEAVQPPVIDPHDSLEELKKLLDLADVPRMIEGVDASTLGGQDAVSSVVTFLAGKPYKSGYRRFRIKTVTGSDDYAMIAETVERRYRRLVRENSPLPDILLIDGGKGHLHAATARLNRLNIVLPQIVSIAKSEEILYTGDPPRELRLKRNSAALRLLQYVRDEAHRFAVHYHHILRGKKIRAHI